MAIAKVYQPENNPGHSASVPGVPLGDLTQELYESLEPWERQSVDGCGFYTDYVEPEPEKVPAPNKATTTKSVESAPDTGDQNPETGGKS